MSDEQPTFKVTDRRLFNADGTPRDVAPEEKSESVEATNSVTDAASPSGVQGTAAARSEERTQQADFESEDETEPADMDDPASFVNFVMSIASNAAASLGVMEHPVTHKREVDLQLAKHWIDVLGMLERKTRGNLDAQEVKILGSLLTDLRMQYVSMADAGSLKGSRAYTGRDITGGR